MTKNRLAASVAIFSLFATAASAATVNIDFDTLPGGAATTPGAKADTAYQSLGVLFSSDDESDPTKTPSFQSVPSYGPTTVLADLSRESTASFNIRADFLNPVSFVSADVTSGDGLSLTMEAFANNGTLLGSVTSAVANLGVYETLSLNTAGISYAIFTTSAPLAGSPIIDNLSFGTGVVPVPASLPLLLGAVGGLAALRRRSRKRC